ncbi:MAG: hypothetical protein OEW00_04720 [candidate division Zixibacteria bacterium]|nr:hypothetical protein [candidate division Zixibacteria bacterium]
MKRSFLGILAVIVFSAVSASGQTFFESGQSFETFYLNFMGGGARAEGMGSAFLGVADDVTGGTWNPAGIFEIEKPILGFSYGSLVPRGKTEAAVMILGDTFSKAKNHAGFIDGVSSLNFVAPLRIKGHQFVGSFSYVRNYDEFQEVDWAYEVPFVTTVIDNVGAIVLDTLTREFQVNSLLDGGMNAVNFAVGTRVYKNLSFGVGANIYTGKTVRDQSTYAVVRNTTVDYFTYQSGDWEIVQNAIDTNKFSGVNFNIGFKLNGDKFDAGLLVRTPFSLEVKTGRSIYNFNIVNGLIESNGTDTTFFDDLVTRYEMPLMIGFGAGFKASENLLLALDMEYRGFSSTKIKFRDSLVIDPGGDNKEFLTEYDPDYNSVILVHLGGEYKKVTSIGTFPLRLGLRYEPLPAPSMDINFDESTPVAYSLSLGTGIHWEQIHFDWAYTYTTINKDVNALGEGFFELKNRNHHLNMSFTGYF